MKKTIFLKVLLVVAFSALLGSCGTVKGLLGMIGLGNLFGGSDIVAAQTDPGGTKGSPNVAQTTPTQNDPTQDDTTVRVVRINFEPVKDSNFEVRQNPDNTITIVKFNPSVQEGSIYIYYTTVTNVVIPETLYNLPVTAIANGAFIGWDEIRSRRIGESRREWRLTSVVIPDTVTTIGNYAFRDNRLTRVTIGKGVRNIGSEAFSGNQVLTEIIIPNSVTEIGDSAFRDCGLNSVTLGSGLKTINDEVFRNNKLIAVTIPNGVTSIGNRAFADNDQLTSVTIPASVTSIGDRAFTNTRLTRVTLPAGLKSIGREAFSNGRSSASSQIQSVTIPAGIERTGSDVFSGNPINSINLPANISDSTLRNYGFEASFISFYGGQNRAAGTYTKNGPIWARSTAGGID